METGTVYGVLGVAFVGELRREVIQFKTRFLMKVDFPFRVLFSPWTSVFFNFWA